MQLYLLVISDLVGHPQTPLLRKKNTILKFQRPSGVKSVQYTQRKWTTFGNSMNRIIFATWSTKVLLNSHFFGYSLLLIVFILKHKRWMREFAISFRQYDEEMIDWKPHIQVVLEKNLENAKCNRASIHCAKH